MEEKNDQKVESIVPEIKQFIRSLMVEKGVDNLPGNMQAEAFADLYDRFGAFLLLNLARSMEEEKSYEFEDKIDREEPEDKIIEFIKENSDWQKVARDTCQEFADIYLANQKSK